MGRVPFIDVTGIYILKGTIARFQKRGVRVILCEANPIVMRKLAQSGVDELLGAENCFNDVGAALSTLPLPATKPGLIT